jgi:hypothetical protein
LGCGYKGLVVCRNNGWIMENMDKGLTVPKWVLIVWLKILEGNHYCILWIVYIMPGQQKLGILLENYFWKLKLNQTMSTVKVVQLIFINENQS